MEQEFINSPEKLESFVDRLKNKHDNPSAKYVYSLLKADIKMLQENLSRCENLLNYCGEFWGGRAQGYGYSIPQKWAFGILEDFAQDLEKYVERRRAILDSFRDHLQIGEIRPAIPPPVTASFGEPITIEYIEEKEMFRIVMPPLVPFRMEKGVKFLYGKVVHFMSEFTDKWVKQHGKYPRVNPAAVVFIHHYDKERRSFKLADYDNLEHRCVLNALQITGLFADSSAHMVSLEMACAGDKAYTEVLIAPVSRLGEIVAGLNFDMYNEGVAARGIC